MNNLCYKLKRFVKTKTYQYGHMFRIGESNPIGFTCENGTDEKHLHAGIHEIKFRNVVSRLTKRYRERYDWFTWHLELQNVPKSKYVYWHIGNDAGDTDLCILSANTCDLTPPSKDGFIGESTDNFKREYLRISDHINKGGRVFIVIE